METQKLIFAFCFLVVYFTRVCQGVSEAAQHHLHDRRVTNFQATKLFVFGDSYADTGNTDSSAAWKNPYGITYPGKPSGRFSDGRVITDYIAEFLGLQTPITYKLRSSPAEQLKYGMNFAYGGTGIFETLVSGPNMTTQIDSLQNLVNQGVYTQQDLQTSLVFVNVGGNDYSTYLSKGGSVSDFPKFSAKLVNQLAVNLKRIAGMGAGKVAVAGLVPIGCLPLITVFSNYKTCSEALNKVAAQHNVLLQQAISSPPYVVLDLYNSFQTATDNKGSTKFETPLKPCLTGANVCSNPGTAFFWDTEHPTQAGWNAVFLSLKSSLQSSII